MIPSFSESPEEYFKRMKRNKVAKEVIDKRKKELIAFSKARKKRKK